MYKHVSLKALGACRCDGCEPHAAQYSHGNDEEQLELV
jgi:hypothetical protein